MANKVNKLYISLGSAAIPTTIGAAFKRVLAFRPTQTTAGTVASDNYGRFLQERMFRVTDPLVKRGANEVSAWFQENAPTSLGSGAKVVLDFIAATGVATTLASIDPVLTRFFRVRAVINRLITAALFPRTTFGGTIYVARQHTIEV